MKDPAVLFYTSDFISGTVTMTDAQRGQYILLLCLQHQKGYLSEKDMLKICKSYDEDIWEKFINNDGKFYNRRMKEESEKRRQYSKSRQQNRRKAQENSELNKDEPVNDEKDMNDICETYVEHMENENENININEIIIKEGVIGGEKKINGKKIDKPDMIDEIIILFQKAYQEIRGDPYVVTNREKERGAAGKLLRLFKERNPGVDTEATKTNLYSFFKLACDVQDKWLYNNMSLSILYSKINEILTNLKNGKSSRKPDLSKGESTISDAFKRKLVERMLTSQHKQKV